jgi:hypothetical protein
VAMMRSSLVSSCLTNSRPMPLLAPRMSQVVKSSSAYKMLGIWFIRAGDARRGPEPSSEEAMMSVQGVPPQ